MKPINVQNRQKILTASGKNNCRWQKREENPDIQSRAKFQSPCGLLPFSPAKGILIVAKEKL